MLPAFPNAYIFDIDGGNGYFPFQMLPPDISDSKSATYQDYPIIGRSVPMKAYTGSPSRQLSFTLTFFTMPIEKMFFPDPYTIKQWVQLLRSYCYPDYTRGIDPPHRALVRLGFAIGMVGVLTSFRANPTQTWFVPGPLLPHGWSVALTFEEVADYPWSYQEVAGGGDY